MVVVPDGRGQGQQALQHSDQDSGRGVAAVQLEVELAFEGVEDRLDGLAQGSEDRRAWPVGLTAAPLTYWAR